eukprot:TRINITY_DN9953_c0_g1_i1.p1 TRINITY_DN9953_c0_g1~~TRINITY_DN9953_c0_g1_i1.p1  ORF type:complete len:600 (-),score=75.61 TRINITY_DN9953_c0_g1_i1:146-1945(-)
MSQCTADDDWLVLDSDGASQQLATSCDKQVRLGTEVENDWVWLASCATPSPLQERALDDHSRSMNAVPAMIGKGGDDDTNRHRLITRLAPRLASDVVAESASSCGSVTCGIAAAAPPASARGSEKASSSAGAKSASRSVAVDTFAKAAGLSRMIVSNNVCTEIDASGDGNFASGEFVHVRPTLRMHTRSVMRRYPWMRGVSLWFMLCLLAFGELATTIWWLVSLGPRGLVFLIAPLLVCFLIAFVVLGLEQVVAVVVSVGLAAVPALPAYSAVLLMVPRISDSPQVLHSNGSSAVAVATVRCMPFKCWDALHLPTLMSLGTMYLAAALMPMVRAERNAFGHNLRAVEHFLVTSQRLARGICLIALWICAAVVLHVIAAHVIIEDAAARGEFLRSVWAGFLAGPLGNDHGILLCLHAVGLVCAQARQKILHALGGDLLPLLLGARRASNLTFRALATKYGVFFWRQATILRRCTPPVVVVAVVVAVRRMAPLLLLLLALLLQLSSGPDGFCCMLPCLLGLGLVFLVVTLTLRECRGLPRSALQRLPHLLPSGFAPRTRKYLGYALMTVEGVEGVRSKLASLFVSSTFSRGRRTRCTKKVD